MEKESIYNWYPIVRWENPLSLSTLWLPPPLFLSLSLSFSPETIGTDEELEFAAILAIHGQLDDNADGSVDFKESEEVHRASHELISHSHPTTPGLGMRLKRVTAVGSLNPICTAFYSHTWY